MPHAPHGGRPDQSSDESNVAALKNRVDALEYQSRESQRAQQEAVGREQTLRMHNAVLRRLTMSPTVATGKAEDAFREICIAAAEALDVDRVGIWFFEDDVYLRAVEVFDRRNGEQSCLELLLAEKYPRYFLALCEDRALAADDARHDSRTKELTDDYLVPCAITSMLDAPVRVEGRIVGVICHEHTGPARQWTLDEQTVAASLGDLVALTVQAKRRREAEQEVLRQREFLKQVIDVSPNVVSVIDREGRFVFVNKALADIAKVPRSELIGRSALDLVTDPEQAERFRKMDRAVLEGEEGDVSAMESFFVESEDSLRWFQISKRPIRAMDGRERQVLTVAVDITERKQYEDRMAMLVRELDHRVKNNLFAVMIMAEQTALSVESLEEFVPTFNGRIRSMSIAHELLARSNWQGASIVELVQRLGQTYLIGDAQRITMHGPNILLPPVVAPALGQILNELLSNAAEHGSLSTEQGRVDLSWKVVDRKLHLHWTERGGPPVTKPEKSKFGLELIERTAKHQLRGEATLHFEEGGFSCELGIPLESAPRREKPDRSPEN